MMGWDDDDDDSVERDELDELTLDEGDVEEIVDDEIEWVDF